MFCESLPFGLQKVSFRAVKGNLLAGQSLPFVKPLIFSRFCHGLLQKLKPRYMAILACFF